MRRVRRIALAAAAAAGVAAIAGAIYQSFSVRRDWKRFPKPERLGPPGTQRFAAAYDADWHRLQESFAARSRRGSARVVPGSDHQIAGAYPDVVAEAVVRMIK